MSLIVNFIIGSVLGFSIGFVLGLIVMYWYNYYQIMREFNNRQERYRRMI